MKKKIVGIFVCMLLILAAIIPIAEIIGAENKKIGSTTTLSRFNTYVNKISPYNIHYSPLTITATGPSDLDFVTLFYRWSKDNISWSGINEVTIHEGFESGSQNTSLWNTFQYGSGDPRIQWNYGTAHSGTYSCAMDDYDNYQYNYALNVIYTNIDFTNATDISINFWEREWNDEKNYEAPDSWTGWQHYDVVAFTNNGNTWYKIFSEADLNKQTFTQFQYDISADPDFSSPPDSNFAIAFQQYDNQRLTSDGRAWDDITIDYTIGAGINWSSWVHSSNPDFFYPWGWNFNFPNGTGYYEFYSIGIKTGDEETPPLVADARCRFNRMPEIYNENPSNGSTNVEIIPQLNISISDDDGDTMTIDWYSNSSGSWKAFGKNTSIEDGTYSQINSNFSKFNTKYWWYVSVTDNIYTNSSPIFHFTTEINLPPYIPSNPNPENDETDVNINVALSWSGGDPEGDGVTYDVYLGDINPPPKVKSNYSGTTYHPLLKLDFETKYYWRIVAWDEHGYSTSGPVWSFTTEENLPPYTPSYPHPENGATNVYIEEQLRWTCGDPNQGDKLSYDVYFGTNSPPPLVAKVNRTVYDPGIMDLGTMYYWQIVAEDSGGKTSTGPIWSFTTEKEPNEPPTKPDIYGPPSGPSGVELCWAFDSDDPDENQIKYVIEWGDGNSIETDYSTITVEACHTYEERGGYTIKAKAIDTHDAESDWETFSVTVPRTYDHPFILWLFERFPHMFPILRHILGL